MYAILNSTSITPTCWWYITTEHKLRWFSPGEGGGGQVKDGTAAVDGELICWWLSPGEGGRGQVEDGTAAVNCELICGDREYGLTTLANVDAALAAGTPATDGFVRTDGEAGTCFIQQHKTFHTHTQILIQHRYWHNFHGTWRTIYKISYDLSYDYLKFVVRSTYDCDSQRAKISLQDFISQFRNITSDDLTILQVNHT